MPPSVMSRVVSGPAPQPRTAPRPKADAFQLNGVQMVELSCCDPHTW